MPARFLRALLVVAALQPRLFAERQVSAADCTFISSPSEFLARATRARDAALSNTRTLGLRGHANLTAESVTRRNFIDDEIFGKLAKRGTPVAPASSDEEFLRRVSLDLTGRLPDPADIRTFAADTSAAKRDTVVDKLLASPEFSDRWTMWMGDWLQNTSNLVNASVNRGAAGRNAFHSYLRDAVRSNKSLRTVAVETVTAAGNTNNSETGAAAFPLGSSTSMGPVQDTYDTMLVRSASMFLGIGAYDCLLCHNGRGHLTLVNAWGVSQTRMEAESMAAFFSRMTFGGTANRGFDVADRLDGGYDLNTNFGNRPDRRPFGSVASLTPEYRETQAAPADGNWRAAFAASMVKDPMFARNIANRLWKQVFNLGLVEPVDGLDPARLDPKVQPPAPWDLQATHPELLEKLAAELVNRNYDLRAFLRVLVQSTAYQLSSRFDGEADNDITLFNRRIARRLEAEEVHDAIAKATGLPGDYGIQGTAERAAWAMQLPEPTEPTAVPAVAAFLNAFLRGDRDTQERSQAGSIQQQLFLMNDPFVTERVRADRSPRLQAMLRLTNNDELLDELYLTFLSRLPRDAERASGKAWLDRAPSRSVALEDLAWVCINKTEFLFSY